MTKEELDILESSLKEHGYKRYTAADFESHDWYWAKSIYKDVHESDDYSHADILISFNIYDNRKYINKDAFYENHPYDCEVQLYMDWFKNWDYFRPLVKTDMSIDNIEKMANTMYEWAVKFNESINDNNN